MSLGASLTSNNFWTRFLFTNGFLGLKDTTYYALGIKLYFLSENE